MNIGVIGLGLIGGSLARAFKKAGNTIFGYDISEETMLKAELLNAISYRLEDNNYKELDLLFIAVYPRDFEKVLKNAAPKLKNGTIILDIASTKKEIVDAMQKAVKDYPTLKFIATHPMAGKEFWGINHSSALLFERASLLMAPVKADINDLVCVKKLFSNIGVASVVMTNAKEHDKIIAFTSQLAHLISSSYIKSETAKNHDGYSAGSFRDLTRVAKLNACMWSQLIYDNRENVIKEMDVFIENITKYQNALKSSDEQELKNLLQEGSEKKEIIDKATREWKRTRNENN
jgi:prephenate dehydrogenase